MVSSVKHPGASSSNQNHKERFKRSPHYFFYRQGLSPVGEDCTQESQVLLENPQCRFNSCICYITKVEAIIEDRVWVKEDQAVGSYFWDMLACCLDAYLGKFKVGRGIAVIPAAVWTTATGCWRNDFRGEGEVFIKRMKVGKKIVQGVEADVEALRSSACWWARIITFIYSIWVTIFCSNTTWASFFPQFEELRVPVTSC